MAFGMVFSTFVERYLTLTVRVLCVSGDDAEGCDKMLGMTMGWATRRKFSGPLGNGTEQKAG